MNETKTEGIFDQAKGKLKQAFGEATGDSSLANEGAADQVKGNVKESWGNVKDAAHDVAHSDRAEYEKDRAADTGHSFRESVTNAAESAKNSIQHGLDKLTHKANE